MFQALDPRVFDQFMTQARIKLPGASDAGVKVELFEVLAEFLNDSSAWTEDVSFQAQNGVQDYTPPLLEHGQVIRFVGVWDDKGIPVAAVMPTFGTIHLIHPQTVTPPAPWTVRFVKNITLPTDRQDRPVVPNWVFSVYHIHILDGLLGKMMGQQDKSFSNGQMSTYHLRRFRTGIQIAKTQAIRQNGVGFQEWAFPRGWSSTSQRGGVSTAWPTRAF